MYFDFLNGEWNANYQFLSLANELIVNRQALVPSPDPLDPIFTSSDHADPILHQYS